LLGERRYVEDPKGHTPRRVLLFGGCFSAWGIMRGDAGRSQGVRGVRKRVVRHRVPQSNPTVPQKRPNQPPWETPYWTGSSASHARQAIAPLVSIDRRSPGKQRRRTMWACASKGRLNWGKTYADPKRR